MAGKASGAALSSLTSRVSEAEDGLVSFGQSLTSLQGQIDGKASGSAVAALTSRVSTSGLNCPISNPYGGSLHVFRGIGGDASSYRIQQVFISAANVMYHRVSGDSGVTWSTWRRLLHNEIILGTVSQTAGAPTGAIIERGSNANGEYVRFADGTQICTRSSVSLTQRSVSHLGADWTFPAAFAAAPVGTITGPGAEGAYINVATADLGVSLLNATSGTTAVAGFRKAYGAPNFGATAQVNSCHLTAIGRWF